MTITVKNKVLTDLRRVTVKGSGITEPTPEMLAKRASRLVDRTKYTVNHKTLPPDAKNRMKLTIDGKEVKLSKSIRFLIEQHLLGKDIV